MPPTRRDLACLLPALIAPAALAAESPNLPSAAFVFEELPTKRNEQNGNITRQVLDGLTHTGYKVEVHLTELSPGEAPHPPHRHVHEEMVMMVRGSLEVTMAGKATRLGSGSSAYVASNVEHGWRNVGTDRALYFVLALGKDS
jgi:quercetin dioxygenase-like cupin family protein